MSRKIVLLTFDGGQATDVVGPHDVFAVANELMERRGQANEGYETILAAPTRGPLRMESGLSIVPDATLDELPRGIDTLIVTGGRGARQAACSAALVDHVARLAKRSRRVASVCTGAFVLGAAGLLDGKRATTHWAFCDRLAELHPQVSVDREPIFVHDGDVWTSAGVTAGMDLSLALVEEDLGRDVSLLVARWLVMFVRRAGGQSQFSAQLAHQLAEREPIRELQTWISEHPEAPLDVPLMAQRAGMSVRNFARVFRAEVGESPAAYVERTRVEAARRLLETSTRTIEEVATATGFGTTETLRRAFSRMVGVSPREYRARFGRPEGRRASGED